MNVDQILHNIIVSMLDFVSAMMAFGFVLCSYSEEYMPKC